MAGTFISTVHMVLFDGFSDLLLIITVLGFILGIVVYGIKYFIESRKFKTHFQNEVGIKVIQKLGPEFTYEPNGKIPESEIRSTHLFSEFNRYDSEDLVNGKIGEKHIRFAEIKLAKVTHKSGGTGKSSETTTTMVFKGIFLTLDLNNNFPSPFWIVPRKWYYTFSNLKGKKVSIDHSEFNKIYKVVAIDPDFVKKLLINPILDKLLSVNEDLKTRKIIWGSIWFAFFDNHISAALNTKKDFLEGSIRRPIDSQEFLEEQVTFLNSIHNVGELFG